MDVSVLVYAILGNMENAASAGKHQWRRKNFGSGGDIQQNITQKILMKNKFEKIYIKFAQKFLNNFSKYFKKILSKV